MDQKKTISLAKRKGILVGTKKKKVDNYMMNKSGYINNISTRKSSSYVENVNQRQFINSNDKNDVKIAAVYKDR